MGKDPKPLTWNDDTVDSVSCDGRDFDSWLRGEWSFRVVLPKEPEGE